MAIDYLIIGHVTQDLTAEGPVLGGTAMYSALTAMRLGRRVALVTRAPKELGIQEQLPGVEVHHLPSKRATTFENQYLGTYRRQIIHHVAPPLTMDDIPAEWRSAPIVHLAPIANEVDTSLIAAFSDSLLCVTPQGWLRRWDETGEVKVSPLPDLQTLFRPVDVMVFSAEDVGHEPTAMRSMIRSVPIVVVTRAARGAVLYTKDGARPSPARPSNQVDPTGAGDVFAAAFFSRLYENGDPYESTAYANVVASFSIEAKGIDGIPTRCKVETWLREQGKGYNGTPG